jgi:twitching motility protein PilJ
VAILSVVLGVVPALAASSATYFFGYRTAMQPQSQLEQGEERGGNQPSLLRPLHYWALGAGAVPLLVGIAATIWLDRSLQPVLGAAAMARTTTRRLQREVDSEEPLAVSSRNEFRQLQQDLSYVSTLLPELIRQNEAESQRAQIFGEIIKRMQQSATAEGLFNTAVETIRHTLVADRLCVFRFDEMYEATLIAESVASGWPKMLWSTVYDPCFKDYASQYFDGRVRAIHDIYKAGISDCHIGLLERFAVKANMVAPILKGDRLFGLLVANQCSTPRHWEEFEISLFEQLAAQLSFIFTFVSQLEAERTTAAQASLLFETSRQIRRSLDENVILPTTVESLRQAFQADRVVFWQLDFKDLGRVVAESTSPGLTAAAQFDLPATAIQAEGILAPLRQGQIRAFENVNAAEPGDGLAEVLKALEVRAGLVAPVLLEGQLAGLLMVQECHSDRDWSPTDIGTLAQLSEQLGCALHHARLLHQADTLQDRVTAALQHHRSAVGTLTFSQQQGTLNAFREQLQVAIATTRELAATTQKIGRFTQLLQQTVREGGKSMSQTAGNLSAARKTASSAVTQIRKVIQSTEKIATLAKRISQVEERIERYSMLGDLDPSTLTGNEGLETPMAREVFSIVLQLAIAAAELEPHIGKLREEAQQSANIIHTSAEHLMAGNQHLTQTQQQLERLAAASQQVKPLTQTLVRTVTERVQAVQAAQRSATEIEGYLQRLNRDVAATTPLLEQLAETIAPFARNQDP